MGEVISFSSYYEKYFEFRKSLLINEYRYDTILKINKKLIRPYDFQLIKNKFNPLNFNFQDLVNFLIEGEIWFELLMPLKNVRGYYIKHFPESQKYLDHYRIYDEKNPLDKRSESDFEYLDVINNQLLGLFGRIKALDM